jgi:alkanesulfonate monooxygenase SsuD/methylene tetrahydromethanopterin reductase-like flavin-dependent oxidoreductase (luciferase family)
LKTTIDSMMFWASLIRPAKRIKLATGTSNLTQTHPVIGIRS